MAEKLDFSRRNQVSPPIVESQEIGLLEKVDCNLVTLFNVNGLSEEVIEEYIR